MGDKHIGNCTWRIEIGWRGFGKIAQGGVKQRVLWRPSVDLSLQRFGQVVTIRLSGQCESPGRGLLALEKNCASFPTSGLFGLSRLMITALQNLCRSNFGEVREDVASGIKLGY